MIQIRLLVEGKGLYLEWLWYMGAFESACAGIGLLDLVFLLDDVCEQSRVRVTQPSRLSGKNAFFTKSFGGNELLWTILL